MQDPEKATANFLGMNYGARFMECWPLLSFCKVLNLMSFRILFSILSMPAAGPCWIR